MLADFRIEVDFSSNFSSGLVLVSFFVWLCALFSSFTDEKTS